MAVLTNTMMQGASAFEEAADGYQIEKSLRFNDPDSSYIRRTNYYSGDRRTWTASFWMKNCYNAPGHIFGAWIDTNNRDNTYFIPTSGKCQFTLNWKTGGSWHVDKSSNEQLRDPSGWTHCVVHWNTPHATATERAKVWANGRELTWGGGYNVTNPSQHAVSIWNAACNHWIGAGPENDGSLQGTYMDGYIADFQFIDGLALYPAAFGSFDSTGNWNPKAFALPAPNTGITWSSGGSGGTNAGSGFDKMFDGLTSTAMSSSGNASSEVTVTFNPALTVQSVEVNPGSLACQFKINSGNFTTITDDGTYHDLDFNGTLTTLTIKGDSGTNAAPRCEGLKVDGVILVDGQTDPTDRTTVWPGKNNGTKWSDFFTAGGNSFGSSTTGGPATQAFDGLITTGSSHSANSIDNTLTFAPPERFTGVTKLEIYTDHHTTQTELRFNSGTNTSPTWSAWAGGSVQTGWNDFTSKLSGGNFAAVETRQTVSNGAAFRAIRINGVILIDSSADNSFHLKFNNTNVLKDLGKDSLSGKIDDATGALPIYNTTDDHGDVKGSGYRADSSAGTTNDTGLVLAIPGDVLTDVHHNINTGSSQKTVTNDTGDAAGSITVKTDESILYGSSMYFNGTGNANLTLPDDADFGFGTGDFCVECWVRHETGGNLEIYYTDVGGDSAGIFLAKDSDDKVYVYYSSTILKGCTVLKIHQWYHVAYVRNSGVSKLYVNGVVDASVADTANLTTTEYSIGNAYSSDIGPFKGWMNDFRVYKGTSKYTANFIPPIHRGFDTINNLLGTADSTYQPILTFQDSTFKDNSHANKTITAVNSAAMISAADSPPTGISYALQSDGTSNKYVTVPNEGFDLSGDFTIEFWMNRSGGDTDWRALVSPDANKGGFFGFTQTTKIGFGRSGVAWDGTSGANKIAADTWHHCVYVREGTNLSAYVDGTREIQSTSNSNDYSITGSTVALGGGENNMVATAQWSNFRVTTDALYDPTSASLTVPTAPLTRKDLSYTADSFTDSPTSYGTDEGAGGEVRGNYCTMNPLSSILTDNSTITDGNLKVTGTNSNSNNAYFFGTLGIKSSDTDGYYYEVTQEVYQSNSAVGFLDGSADITAINTQYGLGATEAANSDKGVTIFNENNYVNYYGTATANATTDWTSNGDVVGVAVKNNKIWIHINGTYHNSGNPATEANPTITLSGEKTLIPMIMAIGNGTRPVLHFNGGQRAFRHAAPSGFKTYCTQNLDDTFTGTDINNPSKFFDARTYTGTGSALTLPANFSTDFSIMKRRNQSSNAQTFDSVNGYSNTLATPSNGQLAAVSMISATTDTSYTLGTDGSVNEADDTYAHWMWDAGSAVASTSNSGSATNYTRWTNATAGFSIIKATISTGSGYHQKTVDHGLSVPPDLILGKGLDANEDWLVYHSSIGTSGVLNLNDNGASDTSTAWKYTATSNSSFTFDSYGTAQNMVYYAWAPIAGYSSFGKYTGNNSDAGPFVYTGFQPSLVIVKTTNTTGNWVMYDNARGPTNPNPYVLLADTNDGGSTHDAWVSSYPIDMLSNGFKLRGNTGEMNGTNTFIYMAWAESPFKTARGN